jgi:hypothetical protein
MLYRLAFKTTNDQYLRVTAFAKGVPNVSAVHSNADVFEVAANGAGISEPTSMKLVAAAREAYTQDGRDVCCELVELSWPQIQALRLQPADGITA